MSKRKAESLENGSRSIALTASPSFSNHPTPLSDLPKDARVIDVIMKSMGVDRYEPKVINQLLEFMHRYVSEVLVEAKSLSEHARTSISDKRFIDIDDARLAVQSRVSTQFTKLPPRELVMELAARKNAIPLPLVSPKYGVRLPAERHRLTRPGFQINTMRIPSVPPVSSAAIDSAATGTSSVPSAG